MPNLETSSEIGGRGPRREPGRDRRAPLPESLPRASKRARGRGEAGAVPAHVRVLGTQLRPEDRKYVRRRLGMKLGKLASSIERITVRVEDVNGPRGGIDSACRVKVVLPGLPGVVVVTRHHSPRAAVDVALDRAERAVRRTLDRRRTKPLKDRTRTGAPPP